MTRSFKMQRADRDEKATEPVDRTSGVRFREPGREAREAREAGPDGAAPAEGPCTSFADVFKRYKLFVWNRSHQPGLGDREAEDVYQTVFEKMNVQVRDEGVPHPVAPTLLKLIGNEVRSRVRSQQRRRIAGEPDADVAPSSKPNPEQLFSLAEEAAWRKRVVEAVFAQMKAGDVELIRMADLDELSRRDMAEAVGETEKTVCVRLHRARARFRELAAPLYNLHRRS